MPHPSLQIQFKLSHLLNTCSSLSALRPLHSLLITTGLLSLHHQTKLLSLVASLSPSPPTVIYARQLFDQIPHPDSYLFNTILRAYSNLGPLDQIFPLYSRMHGLSLTPDNFTFPFVLRSSAMISRIHDGKQAHCNCVKYGLDSDVFVRSALVFLYSCCGELSDMELVFEGAGTGNVVLWTAVVAGYVQNSMYKKGMGVFRRMVEENVRPNEVTIVSVLPACNGPLWIDSGRLLHGFVIKAGFGSYPTLSNALIAMYGKCGELEVAHHLFDEMPDKTMVSWNTMVAVYGQSGDGGKAIELFRRMSSFNAVTLVSVVSACTTLGALDVGKWVHELATSRGLHTDVRVGNALIDMYSNCGSLDLAREVFQKIESKGVVSWSAMMGAYAAHGHAKEALDLFDQMNAEGVKPNGFTFTSVLSACAHSGLVDEGLRHFASMKQDYGIVPKVEHCACVVDMLGRARRLKEAYEFVKAMELRPDMGVWGALLSACRIHGDIDMAEVVANDEVFMAERCNATYCVVMSNIYADAGRWREAASLRRLMKRKELKKMPGCSSVET